MHNAHTIFFFIITAFHLPINLQTIIDHICSIAFSQRVADISLRTLKLHNQLIKQPIVVHYFLLFFAYFRFYYRFVVLFFAHFDKFMLETSKVELT